MAKRALIPYGRFFELYTLHYLEQHTTSEFLLKVSIAALRYGTEALRATPTTRIHIEEPERGADYVRRVVFPRWRTLLDHPEPYTTLGLDWDENMQLRAAKEVKDTLPTSSKTRPHALDVYPAEAPALPSRAGRGGWLDRLRRALEVADTALRTLATLAGLFNDWRAQRRRRELLDAQRELLQAAMNQTLAGADEAFRLADEPGIVAGYLAEHAGEVDDEDN